VTVLENLCAKLNEVIVLCFGFLISLFFQISLRPQRMNQWLQVF